MGGKSSKPSFFWQGVMILSPVLLLAAGGLASLRLDEQSAERDARKKAGENAQTLARVVGYTAADEMVRFLTIENVWSLNLLAESQPRGRLAPDQKLRGDIAQWKQDYPDLKFSDWATFRGLLDQDGRQIDPPDATVAPSPPKWFRELSLPQQQLWQALREKLGDDQQFQRAKEIFLNSGISGEARQAALNLEQRLKYHHFSYGVPLTEAEYSESGISFRGIGLAQMLRDPSLNLSNCVQEAFYSEVAAEPSFLAPMLLEMAEARTNEADARTREKVGQIREVWEMQVKKRQWMEPLRPAPELKTAEQPGTRVALWSKSSAGNVLVKCDPMTFQQVGADSQGVPFSGKGYMISFVPGPVIEAIVRSALAKNSSLVPDFAEAVLSVDGEMLTAAPKRNNGKDVLAMASCPVTTSTFPETTFEVEFLLTSRTQMLAAERRRAGMVGLLILGAVGATLVGFVSARKAFQTQLQLNETKSNFVSSVSHELRAPIASVRLMAESLERGKVAEGAKQNEYYRFIVQECRRLSSLIENVLDFSRIEQGRKQYEFEPTDVLALTRETVKLMEPYAEEKGVRLALEIPNSKLQTPNLELEMDGRAMQQALVNLIDNAIKHSAKGQTVTVGLDAGGADLKAEPKTDRMPVLLWVEDHGPGIPPGEHEKIFERFYRLGSELRRETQGVGIGLSIVRHIVAAHGGKVTVRSNVGEGSRFTIVLPVDIKPQMNADERR